MGALPDENWWPRKTPKSYGTRKLAEGPAVGGRWLVVAEDVITSGGQVLESATALRERGAEVRHAVCVVDREAGGTEALWRSGIELRALFVQSDLVATT